MKKGIKYILLTGIVSLAFFSCKKEQQPVVYMGYDYFPNNVGHYVIYQCDSIAVVGFNIDTFKYQIKEVIDSVFKFNGTQEYFTQRIVRYKRTDTTIPWSNIFLPEKVWTGTLLPNMAKRQEDNIVYVKLVFPMSLNEQWNGNAFDTITGQGDYQYTTLNTPLTINGTTFDSTLTVMQVNQSSFLSYQYCYEQYAAGVGLIYKEVIDYSDTSFISNPPPVNSATSGTILYTETYLSSGNQ